MICDYLAIQKDCYFWINSTVGIFDPIKKIYRKPKSPYQKNGTADILGIFMGKFLAIEVKRKGTYPSNEQKAFIEQINQRGGLAFVARSIDDVILALSTYRKQNSSQSDSQTGSSS